MFTLTKNDIINTGKCWYTDEYNNTVFVHKNNLELTLRLRFDDKNMVALPMKVTFPIEEGVDGLYLSLTPESRQYYNSCTDLPQSVTDGIKGFNELLNHWINLMYDIIDLYTVNAVENAAEREEECKLLFAKLGAHSETMGLIMQLSQIQNHI